MAASAEGPRRGGGGPGGPAPRPGRTQGGTQMRHRKLLHLAVIFSMVMTLVSVAFPAVVAAQVLLYNPLAVNFPDPVVVGLTEEFTTGNTPSGVVITNTSGGPVQIDTVVMTV